MNPNSSRVANTNFTPIRLSYEKPVNEIDWNNSFVMKHESEMTPAELGSLGGMTELVRNALCEITLNGIVPIDETGFSIKMDAGFKLSLLDEHGNIYCCETIYHEPCWATAQWSTGFADLIARHILFAHENIRRLRQSTGLDQSFERREKLR